MNCDPNSLSKASSCIRCLTDAQLMLAKTFLLCRIANHGISLGPSNLDITAGSTSANIVLTWTNPGSQGTTNEVWRSTDGITFALFTTVAGSATTATDASGLAVNGFYYYKVRSCTGSNCTPFSSVISCCNTYTSPNVATISFPTLIRAFGSGVDSFKAVGLALLTSVSLPALKRVDGNLDISTNANLTSIILTALTTVGTHLFLGNNKITGAFSLPALISTGGDIQLQSNTLMTSINAPLLQNVTTILVFSGCTALTSFNFNSLQTVGNARLDFSGCTALPSASFPSLTQIGSELDFNNCNVLASVSLPVLTTITAPFIGGPIIAGQTCPLLVTFSAPSLNSIGDNQGTLDISGCALNAASVNQVLADCSAAGVTTLTINLQGGTNAAPTGQGIIDKGNLIAAGNTVNTN